VYFRLLITETALAALPERGARAHSRLAGSVTRLGVKTVAGAGAEVALRSFKREDEADQFAAALLRRVAGSQALPACLGLAELFARLGADGQTRSAEWLSTHPSPERRAETIRNECERAAAAEPARPRTEIPAAGYRLTPRPPRPRARRCPPTASSPAPRLPAPALVSMSRVIDERPGLAGT
jgi:hypothetical protein